MSGEIGPGVKRLRSVCPSREQRALSLQTSDPEGNRLDRCSLCF